MKNGGVARPAAARKWRTAGKVSAAAARVRAAWRAFWSVGAACMRPAAVYPTNPFFGRDRVWFMRRAGNHAARETVVPIACSRFAWCLFCIVGRAIYLRPKSRRCAAVGHLRAKSRALRPGCAPKRRCGASPKRACGRSARRKRYHIATAWVVCCESWPVGAACMRPAAVCPMVPFFGRDRVRSMRRGGIDAARRNGAELPVAGSPVVCLAL